jgi:hypothetical protein
MRAYVPEIHNVEQLKDYLPYISTGSGQNIDGANGLYGVVAVELPQRP